MVNYWPMPKGIPKNGVNKGWFSKTNRPKPLTKEQVKKKGLAISKANSGRKLPDEWKQNIALGMKGKHANEKNPMWKGDNVKYMGLHNWIRRHFGTPKLCEACGTTAEKMYHWANKSGRYKRDRKDWLRLCVSCHKKHDTGKLDL